MKVWLILTATWIWWAAIVGPMAWVCSSSLSMTGGGHNNNLSLDKVEFRVRGCTKKSYSDFLQSLRTHLSSGTRVHDILLLPAQSVSRQDLLLVQLFDWTNISLTLVLNRVNARVIAYQAQKRYYLLADTPENPELYGRDWRRFSFTGSYGALQNVAKENRENIDLGIDELARTIATLYYLSPPTAEGFVARAFIVLIQMVSETARFRTIEKKVTDTIIDKVTPIKYGSFRPGVGVTDLQTKWETLSTAVHRSNQDGVFLQPVEIQISSQQKEVIKNATTAREFAGLALLLY